MTATVAERPDRRNHICPGGCGRRVANHRFACRIDWYRLPIKIRMAITGYYKRNPDAHAAAMADAVEWYADHPRAIVGGDPR